MFCWDAGDALVFQGQLQAYGAIAVGLHTGRRKLPWHYRRPNAVATTWHARLLALNAERYAGEVAQGRHGGNGKLKRGAAPASGAKRRGRPP